MASIRQQIKNQLAEENMTAKDLAQNIGTTLMTIKSTLQKMSNNWEVKIDKSIPGSNKHWMLTVPMEPPKRWTFKELLRAWK
jgi:predicted ArsR family transcriptional regulator